MTIPLTTDPGGLFVRLGKIGNLLFGANYFQSVTFPTAVTEILNQYFNLPIPPPPPPFSEPDLAAPMVNASSNVNIGQITPLASGTVGRMVYEDRPDISQNQLNTCLVELIRQMKANSQSVFKSVVTLSIQAGLNTNQGNGTIVASTLGGDGLTLENLFQETLWITCTSSGTNPGNEPFSVRGNVSENNALASDWPLGSGASGTIRAIDASKNFAAGTIIGNGDFEQWTVNTPAVWTISPPSAASLITKGTNQPFSGSSYIVIAGDGTTQVLLLQPVKVLADTTYAVNFWAKVDVTPAAGQLSFHFKDGIGQDILDDQGNNPLVTANLTTMTPLVWTNFNGVLRTSANLPPSGVNLCMQLRVPMSSGSNLMVDRAGVGMAAPAYPGGPEVAVFSGPIPFLTGDGWRLVTTNARGGSGSVKTFQTLFDRLFNMRSLGLLLPSSGSPTISDGLIS